MRSLVLSPEENRLFSASKDATIKIWNIRDLQCLKTLSHHSVSILSLCMSKEKEFLFASSGDQSVSVISVIDYNVVTRFKMKNFVNSLVLVD